MKMSVSLRALPVLVLMLEGCAPAIRHQVLTPPPSAPRSEFRVETPAVQSRAVGDEAWRENARWSAALAGALDSALQAAGKMRGREGIAHTIRSRIYLAYGTAPVRTKRVRRGGEYVEVRIELLDADGTQVRYSTFTKVKLEPSPLAWMGVGEDAATLIDETLRRSAADFVSRL